LTFVLDAGAFVAVERNDRELIALLKREFLAGRACRTHGGVIGQVWRGGAGRQAVLSRFLAGVEVVPLGDALGRRAGALLVQAGGADVIDAAVVLLAQHDDVIITSDPDDLRQLAEAAGTPVELLPV
jgi:hypothetical protein